VERSSFEQLSSHLLGSTTTWHNSEPFGVEVAEPAADSGGLPKDEGVRQPSRKQYLCRQAVRSNFWESASGATPQWSALVGTGGMAP
jgi:hypothetical protein